MDVPISHLDLIEGARSLRRAAMGADVDAVHGELCELRNDLARHLSSESDSIAQLSPVARRLVTKGTKRLRSLIDELLAATGGDADADCACLARSDELFVELMRQARLENDVFVARSRSGWGTAGVER